MGKSSTSSEHPPENATYASVLTALILTGSISLHQDLCFGLLGIRDSQSLRVFCPELEDSYLAEMKSETKKEDWLDEFWGLLYVTQKDAEELVLS